MFKTVSGDCNLKCTYCYYGQYNHHFGAGMHRIERPVLHRFMEDYLGYVDGVGSFGWQGGEPLLAGIEFFRQVVELEGRCARPNTILSNAIQTNATLVNDEWADFFRQYRFLVGVSLDGPPDINDAQRIYRKGAGSFDQVMQGIETLRRHQVDFNILTVISPANVRRGREIMEFFKGQGYSHIQLIPCMDFQAFDAQETARYLISPEEYGDFLCEVFDHWLGDGVPRYSVRMFENVLAQFLNVTPDSCYFRGRCDSTLVVEHNGDVYPCDFYIHPRWKLGNITTHTIREMHQSEAMQRFAAQKTDFPTACKRCDYKRVCLGGCPRNRVYRGDRPAEPDYFCTAYLRLYTHAFERMRRLANLIKKRNAKAEAAHSNRIGGHTR